jgi:3,4-dihydroxy 2-butanone 4-phosphate synthase/GTP cyclohydrolase II
MHNHKNTKFEAVEAAIKDIQQGKMVILTDDEDRENEGDLVVAAEKTTPEIINFMAQYGRGLICLAMSPDLIDKLQLPMMTTRNESKFGTAFTVSIEARQGVTTGISAFDRAHTIATAVADNVQAADIVTPGHVFPLRARSGGVLVRAGQTEGSVDLSRLAGLKSAGVICEIMREDGQMARMPELEIFSKQHNIRIVTVADLIQYRINREKFITKVETAQLPTEFGEFSITCYEDTLNNQTHIALVKGDITSQKDVLVRVHSECLTGDVFHSLRCDCGTQLSRSLEMINQAGAGVLLYMRQEGRGIGLANKLKAYKLQEQGMDTVDANLALGFGSDLRDYGIGAQILKDLGITRMQLITNNPKKIVGLEGYGLTVTKRVPLVIEGNQHNAKYLQTKKERMGHLA